MKRRDFFKKMAAGTAGVAVAATIPIAILKAAEEKVKEMEGRSAEYSDWNNEVVMWDTICFKGGSFWLAAVTGITMCADPIIKLIPYQSNEGPEGEIKGAKFERKLSWLKENTILFKNTRYFRSSSEYRHHKQDFTHGWKN